MAVATASDSALLDAKSRQLPNLSGPIATFSFQYPSDFVSDGSPTTNSNSSNSNSFRLLNTNLNVTSAHPSVNNAPFSLGDHGECQKRKRLSRQDSFYAHHNSTSSLSLQHHLPPPQPLPKLLPTSSTSSSSSSSSSAASSATRIDNLLNPAFVPNISSSSNSDLRKRKLSAAEAFDNVVTCANAPKVVGAPTVAPNIVQPDRAARNSDKKELERLYDITCAIIQTTWPNHSASHKTQLCPLRCFIVETHRLSHLGPTVLKVALYYLLRVRGAIESRRQMKRCLQLQHQKQVQLLEEQQRKQQQQQLQHEQQQQQQQQLLLLQRHAQLAPPTPLTPSTSPQHSSDYLLAGGSRAVNYSSPNDMPVTPCSGRSSSRSDPTLCYGQQLLQQYCGGPHALSRSLSTPTPISPEGILPAVGGVIDRNNYHLISKLVAAASCAQNSSESSSGGSGPDPRLQSQKYPQQLWTTIPTTTPTYAFVNCRASEDATTVAINNARTLLRQQQQQQQPNPLRRSASDSKAASLHRADVTMCGRRMYVAALILASKFLLDRTYSNRAWNKITRLDIKEINEMERAFMALLDSQLYIPPAAFERWDKMLPHITVKGCRLVVGDSNSCDEVLLRPFLSPPTPAPSPISVCGGISAPASPAPTANSGSGTHHSLPASASSPSSVNVAAALAAAAAAAVATKTTAATPSLPQ